MTPSQAEKFAKNPPHSTGPSLSAMALTYGTIVIGAVVLLFVIDSCGGKLAAPEPVPASTKATDEVEGKPNPLVHVLIALAAVLITGRLLSILFSYLGQ